jgi:hypothetical protein
MNFLVTNSFGNGVGRLTISDRYEAAAPPHSQNLQPEKSLNKQAGEKQNAQH